MICSSLDLTLNGERKTGVAWIPEPPDEGYRISIEGLDLVWTSKLMGWLPESSRGGDTLIQVLADSPAELRYLAGPGDGLGAWIGAIEQTDTVRGNFGSGSFCPAGMTLVDAFLLKHPGKILASLLYDLTRRRIEWILTAEGPDISLVSSIDPRSRLPLGSKQASRLLRRAKVAALCGVSFKSRYGETPNQ